MTAFRVVFRCFCRFSTQHLLTHFEEVHYVNCSFQIVLLFFHKTARTTLPQLVIEELTEPAETLMNLCRRDEDKGFLSRNCSSSSKQTSQRCKNVSYKFIMTRMPFLEECTDNHRGRCISKLHTSAWILVQKSDDCMRVGINEKRPLTATPPLSRNVGGGRF